jgi:hypothetical protein
VLICQIDNGLKSIYKTLISLETSKRIVEARIIAVNRLSIYFEFKVTNKQVFLVILNTFSKQSNVYIQMKLYALVDFEDVNLVMDDIQC